LGADGVPVAGVDHAPALGRLWWGGRGEGSCAAGVDGGVDMARLGEVTPIGVRPAPREGLTLVGSCSHGVEPDAAWLAAYRVSQYSAIGSSLKFCLVAEGKADLYPRFGRTMEWDTAAGDAILRAAGGMVVDAQRQALCY